MIRNVCILKPPNDQSTTSFCGKDLGVVAGYLNYVVLEQYMQRPTEWVCPECADNPDLPLALLGAV